MAVITLYSSESVFGNCSIAWANLLPLNFSYTLTIIRAEVYYYYICAHIITGTLIVTAHVITIVILSVSITHLILHKNLNNNDHI